MGRIGIFDITFVMNIHQIMLKQIAPTTLHCYEVLSLSPIILPLMSLGSSIYKEADGYSINIFVSYSLAGHSFLF